MHTDECILVRHLRSKKTGSIGFEINGGNITRLKKRLLKASEDDRVMILTTNHISDAYEPVYWIDDIAEFEKIAMYFITLIKERRKAKEAEEKKKKQELSKYPAKKQ